LYYNLSNPAIMGFNITVENKKSLDDREYIPARVALGDE
jgi:hypothetical protein